MDPVSEINEDDNDDDDDDDELMIMIKTVSFYVLFFDIDSLIL